MTLPSVPVASVDNAYACLADESGSPVLPFAGGDAERLAAIAVNMGATLRFMAPAAVRHSRNRTGERAGAESVVAYGRNDPAAAHLYAHLTGRRVALALDVAALHQLEVPAVVIALADDADDDLTDWAQGLRSSTPGLILGRNTEELRLKLLATAIGVMAGGGGGLPHLVELSPNQRSGFFAGRSCTFAGGGADPDTIRAALRRGGSLIRITGHGDGIDGDLGGGLILCPNDREFRRAEWPRPPQCRSTGQCHRTRIPLADPALARRTLTPDAVTARLLIWNTCIGFPAQASFIDRRYGVGLRLATSPAVGALVTTGSIVLSAEASTQSLIQPLLGGETVGSVIGRHNAAADATSEALLLFGDPALRIAPVVAADERDPRGEARTTSVSTPAPSAPLKHSSRSGADATLPLQTADRPPAVPLMELIAGLKGRAGNAKSAAGRSPVEAQASQHETHHAFERLVAALHESSLESLWLRHGAMRSFDHAARCQNCGAAATCYRIKVQTQPPLTRHLTICRACEIVGNTEGEPPFTITLSRAMLSIEGAVPGGDWHAALIWRQRWPLGTRLHRWPQTATGAPAVRWAPPVDNNAAASASVLFVVDGQCHLFGRTMAATGAPAGFRMPATLAAAVPPEA
ncbi:hypothetical protein [Mangrovicella endophytica]|uniref:hypothetical protein n=1 Tax=Mangrovicella endophytica TaxID=2066697 RepID=UPI000C9E749F|nr:hypothetical protein [Mangrovicella endophytica]